jgi:hypothetical protein
MASNALHLALPIVKGEQISEGGTVAELLEEMQRFTVIVDAARDLGRCWPRRQHQRDPTSLQGFPPLIAFHDLL